MAQICARANSRNTIKEIIMVTESKLSGGADKQEADLFPVGGRAEKSQLAESGWREGCTFGEEIAFFRSGRVLYWNPISKIVVDVLPVV